MTEGPFLKFVAVVLALLGALVLLGAIRWPRWSSILFLAVSLLYVRESGRR